MENIKFTAQDLLRGVEKMNSCGIRLTGSPAQKKFIQYLQSEIMDMGLTVKSNTYTFDRWEEKSKKLTVDYADGTREIHIASAYPYSGETSPEGVSGQLQLVAGKYFNYFNCKDKIAVVRIKDPGDLPNAIAYHQVGAFPEELRFPKYAKGPVGTAFFKFPGLKAAKKMGAKAVVLIWEGLSDKMIEGQYLSFIRPYMGIPCVWINETDGKELIAAAERHEKATLILESEIERNCTTESFYTVIEGCNSDETVLINTHTDGVNAVEENGAIAMLEMLRYFKEHKPQRTLVFAFVTGHFHICDFQYKRGQATSVWLNDHPELWDGKRGHKKCVAVVTVEHLGCTEWKDVDGVYTKTNDIDYELVYIGNAAMQKVYFEALEHRTKVRSITLSAHNGMHFGEGKCAFANKIPEISLCTAPDYLCVASDNHEMDKLDIELMFEQTQTFIRCLEGIDKLSTEQIGQRDPSTYGLR